MKPAQVPATLQVGKNGVTESLGVELREQLKRRGIVKVKMLRSARKGETPKEAAERLAQMSGGVLVDLRGGAAVFARPGVARRA